MSANLTDAQFAAFIDRIIECRKMEDEAKEDTKQVYTELAGAGGDKTAAGLLVRALRMDEKQAGKAQARQELVEEYRDRYQRGKASHVRAREASQSYAEVKGGLSDRMDGFVSIPFNAETGELTDTQEQPETAKQSGRANVVSSDAIVSFEAGTVASAASAPTESVSDEISAPHSQSDAASSDAATAPQAPQSVAASISDDDVPAFLLNERNPLRPNCLHPENCAGYGSHTCHACTRAAATANCEAA